MGTDFPNETVLADVRDRTALCSAFVNAKALINLAAEHRDDVHPIQDYYDVNVDGAENTIFAARRLSINTIVFTSSVAVYGFAPLDTDEQGPIKPFNHYGISKFQAEEKYRAWQAEDPAHRRLVIVRPTVVFGERNRGNVYNLLRQIASGSFVMVGDGMNRKSIAYVQNVVDFLCFVSTGSAGVFVYNYVDKPDFLMRDLVRHVRTLLGRPGYPRLAIPYWLGLSAASCIDAVAKISRRKFPISAVRVRKFCSNSVYASAVDSSGFTPTVRLEDAIAQTVQYEFLSPNQQKRLFFSE
jgi:nucleoside-diphosphate-sugar epimerase